MRPARLCATALVTLLASALWCSAQQRRPCDLDQAWPHTLAATIPAMAPEAPAPIGGSWSELGPKPEMDPAQGAVTGRITAIAIDSSDPTGNTVYLGAAGGGVWRSTNAFSAQPVFTPIGDGLPTLAVGSLALDGSTVPTTIHVGTGEANLTADSYYGVGTVSSGDGGQSWTAGLAAAGTAVARLLMDPENPRLLLAAVTTPGDYLQRLHAAPSVSLGVYRSTDGGATWELAMATTGTSDLAYDPAVHAYYAAVPGVGVCRSGDGGLTWQGPFSPFGPAVGVTLTNFQRGTLAIRGGIVYLLTTDTLGQPTGPADCAGAASCTGLAASADGGATWQPLNLPPGLFGSGGNTGEGNHDQVLATPAGSNAVLVGGIDLWAGVPDGSGALQWSDLTGSSSQHVATNIYALACLDAQRWIVGTGSGAWSTTDAGAHWTDMNATLAVTQFNSLGATPAVPGWLLGGTQGQGGALIKATSLSTVAAWTQTTSGVTGAALIAPQPSHPMLLETGGALERSDDDGGSFQPVVTSATIADLGPGLVPLALDPADPGVAYLGSTQVWRGPLFPAAAGAGWAAISPAAGDDSSPPVIGEPPTDQHITALAVAPGGSTMAIGRRDSLVESTANLSAPNPDWSIAKWSTDHYGEAVGTLSYGPQDSIFASWATANGGLIQSLANGGWRDSGTGLPGPVNAVLVDPKDANVIYAATDHGVFAAADGSIATASWRRLGSGLPASPVTALALMQSGGVQTLLAATHGRGAWSLPTPADFSIEVSPAKEVIEAGQPAAYSIQSHAWNGASTVTLSCPQAAQDWLQCSFANSTLAAGAATALTLRQGSAWPNAAAFTLQASNGFSTQNVDVGLVILDFEFSGWYPPPAAALAPGGSLSYTLELENNQTGIPFDAPITLACPAAPSGVTCQFSPAEIDGLTGEQPVTATISAAPGATLGSASFAIVANGGHLHREADLNLLITPFTLAATPNFADPPAGQPVSTTLSVTSLTGFSGPVTFSCAAASGAPQPACTFAPATIAPGQTTAVTVSGYGPGGVMQMAAHADGIVMTTTFSVQPRDFQVFAGASPQTLPGSNSVTLPVTSGGVNFFFAPIQLSCTPTATACAFSPPIIYPGQSSLLTITGLAQLASAPVTIIGTGTGTNASLQHTVSITAGHGGDFSPTVGTPRTVFPGEFAGFDVSATGWGYGAVMTITCGPTPGFGCAVKPEHSPSVVPGVQAEVLITNAPAPGTVSIPVIVTGSEGGATLSHTVTVPLHVASVTMTADPASATVKAGDATYIEITTKSSVPLLSAPLTWSCSGLPAGASCQFAGNAPVGTPEFVSIQTQAGASTLPPPSGPTNPWVEGELLALFLLLAWAAFRPRWRVPAMLALVAALAACGGGTGNPVVRNGAGGAGSALSAPPGSPSGASTVTITATDATSGLTTPFHVSVTVPLTID